MKCKKENESTIQPENKRESISLLYQRPQTIEWKADVYNYTSKRLPGSRSARGTHQLAALQAFTYSVTYSPPFIPIY